MDRGIFYGGIGGSVSSPPMPNCSVDSIEMYEQSLNSFSVDEIEGYDIKVFSELGSVSLSKNTIDYTSPQINTDDEFIMDTIYVYYLASKQAVGEFKVIQVKVNKIPAEQDDLISNDDLASNAALTRNLI